VRYLGAMDGLAVDFEVGVDVEDAFAHDVAGGEKLVVFQQHRGMLL